MDAAKTLISRGLPLRAILFQVFSGEQYVPEMKLTHLAIALDAIKTAMIEKVRGEGKAIPNEAEFQRRIKAALDVIEKEFNAPEEAEAAKLIQRRLRAANDWSERERWLRFWRDVIGYEMTPEEQAVLAHRNVAVHVGYILKTEYDLQNDDDPNLDRRPYDDRLRELVHDAKVFRNLVDRVLLTILGYRGAFVDATDRAKTIEIADTKAEVT